MSTPPYSDTAAKRGYYESLDMVQDIATTLGNQNKLSHDGPVYHVTADPKYDWWKVLCIGIECVDNDYTGTYYSSDELPEELRDKILRLSVLEPQTPQVARVGLRSGPVTFWVFGDV
jgi:hypothetical protein